MKTFLKKTGLALGLGATALVGVAPAEAQVARYRGHDDTGVALVAGLAGLAVGAAIASSNDRGYRDDGYYYDDYDGYPQSGYYATPGYYGYSYNAYPYAYPRSGYRGYYQGHAQRGYYQGHGGYGYQGHGGAYGYHRGR